MYFYGAFISLNRVDGNRIYHIEHPRVHITRKHAKAQQFRKGNKAHSCRIHHATRPSRFRSNPLCSRLLQCSMKPEIAPRVPPWELLKKAVQQPSWLGPKCRCPTNSRQATTASKELVHQPRSLQMLWAFPHVVAQGRLIRPNCISNSTKFRPCTLVSVRLCLSVACWLSLILFMCVSV